MRHSKGFALTFIHHLISYLPQELKSFLTKYFTEILTDGFEGVSPWDDSEVKAGCSLDENDTSNPHHGSQNLLAMIPAGVTDAAGEAFLLEDVSAYNPVYIRAMNCKFDYAPPVGGDQRVLSVNQAITSAALAYGGVYNDGGTLKWFIRWVDQGGSWHNVLATSGPTLNTNYCMEFGFYRHATAGWIRLWVNGGLVAEVNGSEDTTERALNYVHLGFRYSDANAANDTHFWADCVIIADAYIGPEVPAVLAGLNPPVATPLILGGQS